MKRNLRSNQLAKVVVFPPLTLQLRWTSSSVSKEPLKKVHAIRVMLESLMVRIPLNGWLASRKIGEDWLNSIGCLQLVLQGNKQQQGMSYATTPLNNGSSMNGGQTIGFAQNNLTVSTLSYLTAGILGSTLPTTPDPPHNILRTSLTGIGDDDTMGLSTSEQDLLDGRAGDLQPPMVLDSSSSNAINNFGRRTSMHYRDMGDDDVSPSIDEFLGTTPKFDQLLEKFERQMAEVRAQRQGEAVDEAVVNARVTKLTSEYETSVKAKKARLDEAIARSGQRTERLKRNEMEATWRSMMSTTTYAVTNPMSITGGSVDSSQTGIVDLKFSGENHWDKKITKVQTVFRSLLETCVLNLITRYLRDNDFCGAWSYLNDMYLGRLEDHVVPIISALDVYAIKYNQTFARYVWIIEVIMDSCDTIRKNSLSKNDRIRILVKGVARDKRFIPLCAAYQWSEPKPSYEEFKLEAMQVEMDRNLELTTQATLENAFG
jgi:hypothetical protein